MQTDTEQTVVIAIADLRHYERATPVPVGAASAPRLGSRAQEAEAPHAPPQQALAGAVAQEQGGQGAQGAAARYGLDARHGEAGGESVRDEGAPEEGGHADAGQVAGEGAIHLVHRGHTRGVCAAGGRRKGINHVQGGEDRACLRYGMRKIA